MPSFVHSMQRWMHQCPRFTPRRSQNRD